MAQSKQFQTAFASIIRTGAALNESCIKAGTYAVKAIYSNQDPEMVCELISQTVPHATRKALATWLRSYGVVIGADYSVGKLDKDQDGKEFVRLVTGKQNKVFADLNSPRDVIVQVAPERKERVIKEMPASERAQKAMESTIARIKKIDPEAAALINDVWAQRSRLIAEMIAEQKPEALRRAA